MIAVLMFNNLIKLECESTSGGKPAFPTLETWLLTRSISS